MSGFGEVHLYNNRFLHQSEIYGGSTSNKAVSTTLQQCVQQQSAALPLSIMKVSNQYVVYCNIFKSPLFEDSICNLALQLSQPLHILQHAVCIVLFVSRGLVFALIQPP